MGGGLCSAAHDAKIPAALHRARRPAGVHGPALDLAPACAYSSSRWVLAVRLSYALALVEKDITKGRPVQSGPELEMGATTLTGSGPRSGDTATVADSVPPKR